MNCELFCDDNGDDQGYTTKLSKRSPFTASILVPDAYRKTPTTVFFGFISPTKKDPIPFEAARDKFMNIVLGGVRAKWVVDFEFIDKAKITITDEQNNSTEFEHVVNGLYEDINNSLSVINGKSYSLKVEYDGKIYTSTTTVPNAFRITYPNSSDTTKVSDVYVPNRDYLNLLAYEWTASQNSYMYRIESSNDDFDTKVLDHTFDHNDYSKFFQDHPEITYVRTKTEIVAFDENFTSIYTPESTYTYTLEWDRWHVKNQERDVKELSSILPKDDVLGVFGSVAIDTIEYVAYADSVQLK